MIHSCTYVYANVKKLLESVNTKDISAASFANTIFLEDKLSKVPQEKQEDMV